MSQDKIGQEILIAEEKINQVAGIRPQIVRAPHGWYPDNLLAAVNTLQYQLVGWNVDPEDWRYPGADKIITRVMEQVKPGSIILLHDGPYTADRRQTVEALPQIIEQLWREGYQFVTVSELLRYQN